MRITDELRGFLTQVDTGYLATASKDGEPYVQHRGGPKGFVRALDDETLGFLDFSGNRQYLSIGNLAENPRVLFFLIDYARRRRVKVWGTAREVPVTAELRAALGTPGYKGRPERAILITVTRWDVNCPAHIPQKLDAAEVEKVVGELRGRIATLEAELAAAHPARLPASDRTV
jgi:predicted pyridoxine 5'-phosphate oxidase superfamily flavin-nucleotide-binding protein